MLKNLIAIIFTFIVSLILPVKIQAQNIFNIEADTIRTIVKGLNFKSIDSIETERFQKAKELNNEFDIVAYNEMLNLDNSRHGVIYELSNGDNIWSFEVETFESNLKSLVIEGDFSESGTQISVEQLDRKNNKLIIRHQLFDQKIETEPNSATQFRINILYRESSNKFKISKIKHYLETDFLRPWGIDLSGDCTVNVNCPDDPNGWSANDWECEKKGIARIRFDQDFIPIGHPPNEDPISCENVCSGSLVNNTNQDCKPYFLTADHCLCKERTQTNNGWGCTMKWNSITDNDLMDWEFDFNFEVPCVNPSGLPNTQTITGATLLANRDEANGTDFALLELDQNPIALGYDVYYNGWSRTTNNPNDGFGIHHPAGDLKKVSIENDVIQPYPANSNFWLVDFDFILGFSESVTEGGSSGSPLFRGDGLIIGQLLGGVPGANDNCDNPSNDQSLYGIFANSYNQSLALDEQLETFLNPCLIDIQSLRGSSSPCCEGSDITCLPDQELEIIDHQIIPSPSCDGTFQLSLTIKGPKGKYFFNDINNPTQTIFEIDEDKFNSGDTETLPYTYSCGDGVGIFVKGADAENSDGYSNQCEDFLAIPAGSCPPCGGCSLTSLDLASYCLAGGFYVDVEFSGTGSNYTIIANSSYVTNAQPGEYGFGPFSSGTTVDIVVFDPLDPSCQLTDSASEVCSSNIVVYGPGGCFEPNSQMIANWEPNPNWTSVVIEAEPYFGSNCSCDYIPSSPTTYVLAGQNQTIPANAGQWPVIAGEAGPILFEGCYRLKIYDPSNGPGSVGYGPPFEVCSSCTGLGNTESIQTPETICLDPAEVIDLPSFPVDVNLEICDCSTNICQNVESPIMMNTSFNWVAGTLSDGSSVGPGCYYLYVYDPLNPSMDGYSSSFILTNCSAPPSCDDGMMNGDETGVDCGGSVCPSCTSCNNSIQDPGETGVDCGGTCPPCNTPETCNDGMLNNGEEQTDCGGLNCAPCPSCIDGEQNNGETDVDCGGPNCPDCPEPCNVDGIQNIVVGCQNNVNGYYSVFIDFLSGPSFTVSDNYGNSNNLVFGSTTLYYFYPETPTITVYDNSNPSCVETIVIPLTEPNIASCAPCDISGVSVTQLSGSSVQFSWNYNAAFEFVTVSLSPNCIDGNPNGGDPGFISQAVVGANNTSMIISGLPSCEELCYRVVPVCANGQGPRVVNSFTIDDGNCNTCMPSPFVIPTNITINCTQDPLDLTITGQASTTCTTCAVPTSTFTVSTDNCNNTGTVTREWTYNDECGNTFNQTQIITIIDNQPPNLIGPNDITVICGSNFTDLTITGNFQSATDNCSADLTPTYTDVSDLTGCGGTGTITRTWSVTDDCDNTGTDVQIITVEAAAGNFTCPPDIIVLCNGSIDPADTGNPVADVCGGMNAASFTDSGTLTAGGTITRTWSMTDACGTPYTCNQMISMGGCISTIDDPCSCADEMNYLFDGAYYFHEVVEITSRTGEQWDMSNISSGQVFDGSGNPLPLPLTGTETPAGSGIYLYNFWHTSGTGFNADYTETTSLNILSIGNSCTVPVLDVVCPATNDLGTYNCNTIGNIPACPTDEASAEAAPYGLTIDDMPCGDIVVLCNDDETANNCVAGNQTITRTITVLDDLNGNGTVDAGEATVDCSFTITIEADTNDPTIDTEAMDMTVQCNGAGNVAELNAWLTNNGSAAASDDCGNVVFTNDFTMLSDDCGATGSATVTFTATDDCGLTASTTATFTIKDTTDPAIDTEAMDMTVECDGAGNVADLDAWLANNGGAAASDDCGSITFTNDFIMLSDDCGATGSATVTFTATDECNMTATTTATFTIEDTTDPVIDTEAVDMTVQCDGAGNVTDLNAWLANNGGAVASDDCGSIIFTNDFTILSDDCGATGSATVTFTATDDCGMTATTTATFTIEDTTDPAIDTEAMDMTVQCDGEGNVVELNAWLANNGGAAASDDCSSIIFTNDFTMLSDDCGATGSATVTFTATNDCGMTIMTTATFTIEDTAGPEITCPADQMLNCNIDPLPTASTIAEFQAIGGIVTDDCSELSELTISFIDIPISQAMLNFCADDPAERTLTRTYTITDICGNASTCEQNFIYEQITTGPVITSVPPDQTVDCAINAIPQAHLLEFTTECAIGATISVSEPNSNGPAGCSGTTIQYTYTVTDVCGRSAVAIQTYTFENESPEFVCPPDICVIECPADSDMIQTQFDNYANLATVITSCSESSISIGNNFSPDNFIPQNCLNPTVAVTGAVAYQIVTFTASDNCGRNSICTALVVIKDSDGPVISGNVSFGLADCNDANLQEGYSDWADNQLNNLSATDECINGEVTFSYDPLTPNVDCSSGLASTLVNFTVTDECGNSSIQTAYYRIIDNGTGEPTSATVSGNLVTEDNEMVALANVEVEGYTNNYMMTNSDGYYHFDLAMAHNYSILPSRNDDPLNGITTYDLVVLGQHLLEFNLLDSPYKMIAADVNESGSITSLDLIQLRRLILHIDDEFSSGKSWTFVEAAYVFPNPLNPFATTYPTSYNINNLTSPEIVDFIGVKLGDLNASANPNLLQAGDTRSSDGNLKIKLEDQLLKAGESYDLNFKASDFKDVEGFQFTLDFDPAYLADLDFEGSELTNMSANNFGFTKTRDGKLTVSWNANQPVIMPDDATLFKISFTTLKTAQLSQIIKLSSSLTANEAYQENLLKEVILDFETETISEQKFVLLQNQPNPFAQETVIGFQLPEATDATLTIFDVSGRSVWSQTENYSVGVHQITVEKDRLKGSGVYYYQLSTGADTAIRKMIVLK